jgi:hypothetical protein
MRPSSNNWISYPITEASSRTDAVQPAPERMFAPAADRTVPEDELRSRLDELRANEQDRKSIVEPLCTLAFLFDGRQPVPCKAVCPAYFHPRNWARQIVAGLSAECYVSAYEEPVGDIGLGFGTFSPSSQGYVGFNSMRQDIIRWTFDAGLSECIFRQAFFKVSHMEAIRSDGSFPGYNVIKRLMEVYKLLDDGAKADNDSDQSNMSIRGQGIPVTTGVDFGRVLLARAR